MIERIIIRLGPLPCHRPFLALAAAPPPQLPAAHAVSALLCCSWRCGHAVAEAVRARAMKPALQQLTFTRQHFREPGRTRRSAGAGQLVQASYVVQVARPS